MNTIISLILLSAFQQTDSLAIDSGSIQRSIMFRNEKVIELKSYKYNHIQGFFCDFEDKINEKKKININIGVGDQ